MRPLPGAARMYPETDVFPVRIDAGWYAGLPVPELLVEKAERFIRDFTSTLPLHPSLLHPSRYFSLNGRLPKGITPSLAARTLLSSIKELARAGIRYFLLL